MNAPTLEERMDNLEKFVEPLRALPGRVTQLEEQIVQLRTEMRGEFSAIRRDMVTKQDAARFATKEDLNRFATKDDLKRFATKDDLKRFATKDDLKRFATKEDLNRFATKEDLNRFATKDDLKRFATKDDLRRFATKEDLADLKDKMLVLHEAVIERLKVLGDALPHRAKHPKKKL